MKLTGLPTLLMTRRLQSYVGDTRGQLDLVRIEAVTGFAADRAEKVGGDIGKIRSLEKLLADGERRMTAVSQFKADAGMVQLTLGPTRDTLASLQYELEGALALENDAGVTAAAAEARSELESLWGKLNSSHAGRYLFSGAKTDTPPLGDLDDFLADVRSLLSGASVSTMETNLDGYFDVATGDFQTLVYQGSVTADAPDREVDQTRRLGITLKAVDPAIRETLRSLATIALGADLADDDLRAGIMQKGAENAGEARDLLIAEQTALGALEGEAALLEARHNATSDVLETQLRELLSVDQYEAATRMNELETQLEASYLTTARIQQLSLVNYLR